MSNSLRYDVVAIALLFVIVPNFAKAQKRKGEFYFSWGYNTEWYTRSNVKIEQPELGNKYAFKNIRGHDHRGWDEGLFSKALTIPQYNYRIGYFFKKDLAIEINFDHTKFIFADQDAHIQGRVNAKYVDTSIAFNKQNGFFYYLNNGANFLLFNIVKRWDLYQSQNGNFKLNALGKAGVGPVVPHVENSFFGQKNDPHFQIGGWNVGVETAVRATFFKTVFLEISQKGDYARYSNLKIYKGKASHAFGTYELIANLGFTFPAGRKVSN